MEGFEPPNGGIKTRCLTTWRHPSICASRAEKRAGAHLTAASVLPPVLETLLQGRGIQAARDVARPLVRHPRREALRLDGVAHAAKMQEPVPSAVPARSAQPIERRRHLGKRARTTGSQSLRPPASKKARIVMRGEFRVNSGLWNTSRRAHPDPRMDDHIPALRQRERRQPLAHPFRPGGKTSNEYRHIRAEWQAQARQLLDRSRQSQSSLRPAAPWLHRSCRRPGPHPRGCACAPAAGAEPVPVAA